MLNEKNGTDLTLHEDLMHPRQTLPLPGDVRERKNLVWQRASEVAYETGAIPWFLLPANLIQSGKSN